MDDTIAIYERGLHCLQEQFSPEDELFCDIALYKSRFLMIARSLRMYGEDNPTENTRLMKVIYQLHRLCSQKFGMDFDTWCEQCIMKEIRQMQQDHLFPYIGDWPALQDGRLQQFLREKLAQQGIKLRSNRIPPREDPIERYRMVPLHAYLLYTSQDPAIAPYILAHWDAIEGISRDVYDLYISVAELNHAEDGHDTMETSYVLQQTGFDRYLLLPGLLFWDKQWNWEFVSLKDRADEGSMTNIFRLLYERLREEPSITTIRKVNALINQSSQTLSPGQHRAVPPSSGAIHSLSLEENLEQFSDLPLLSIIPPDLAPATRRTNPVASSASLSQSCTELIERLKQMPTGDGSRYEKLVEEILRLCFSDEFHPFNLEKQLVSYNQKRRRDFIIDNIGARVEKDFWQSLKIKNGVEKILFDAKNYKKPMSYSQITETLRYLENRAFGNFIIFISRQGMQDLEEILEDYDRRQRITLVLSDVDVVAMIERKQAGETASSFIREKYHRFLTLK